MVLFVAADAPLRTVAATDPPSPLSVRELEPNEGLVRAQFGKPFVYFVGAHTGCSCGFSYGVGGDDDLEGRLSVTQLSAYLTAAVNAHGPIELFACWNGDEDEAPEVRESVTPSYFGGNEFELPERWFATVAG